jgi:hypothetical protein
MAQSRYPLSVRVTPNSSAATSTASAEPSSKDQLIALKRGHHRDHIHRYTLTLKILTCHSEEDEQNLIRQELINFFAILLRADN